MTSASSPTPSSRWAGLLVALLALVAVIVGAVVMTPAAPGWGESIGTPHVHAAGDLHAPGTGHGVGDSHHAAEVTPAFVSAPAAADPGVDAALLGATVAAAAIALLLAALGRVVARALRHLPGDSAWPARPRPPMMPVALGPPPPPRTPAVLSVFRI
ncbi:hypothetical protein [Clavibacter zhangzhiyongii]|jgi:hypothetical protein|uniref:hypothetical protein n=1 Tax=Clavibacter zhangzhiyongii TaxID=2768071 RepID=UPI0039DF64CA